MAKWCDEGETAIGNVFFKGSAQPDIYLGLYENSVEPAEDATLASLTEQSGSGYARIQLADGDWSESPIGTFTNTQKTFTASGGDWGDQYGYFLCDCASGTAGDLFAVEHFSDGPYAVNDGWSVKITPKVAIG
jgi:hypothetical protein